MKSKPFERYSPDAFRYTRWYENIEATLKEMDWDVLSEEIKEYRRDQASTKILETKVESK